MAGYREAAQFGIGSAALPYIVGGLNPPSRLFVFLVASPTTQAKPTPEKKKEKKKKRKKSAQLHEVLKIRRLVGLVQVAGLFPCQLNLKGPCRR